MSYLKNLRKRLKLTQRDVAEILGVDHTVISKIENGRVRLSTMHIDKLADHLQIEPNEILSDQSVKSDQARRVAALFDQLSPADQATVERLIDALSQSAPPPDDA